MCFTHDRVKWPACIFQNIGMLVNPLFRSIRESSWGRAYACTVCRCTGAVSISGKINQEEGTRVNELASVPHQYVYFGVDPTILQGAFLKRLPPTCGFSSQLEEAFLGWKEASNFGWWRGGIRSRIYSTVSTGLLVIGIYGGSQDVLDGGDKSQVALENSFDSYSF